MQILKTTLIPILFHYSILYIIDISMKNIANLCMIKKKYIKKFMRYIKNNNLQIIIEYLNCEISII